MGASQVRLSACVVLLRSSSHSLEGGARQPVAAGATGAPTGSCCQLFPISRLSSVKWRRDLPCEFQDLPLRQVYITPATLHTASINSIAWAPHELGLILAVGSSDGTSSILEYSAAAAAWNTTKVSCLKDSTGQLSSKPAQACLNPYPCVCDTLQLPGTHAIGVTAVSWAPAVPSGALVSSKAPGPFVKRLVTAGCDNAIKVGAGGGNALRTLGGRGVA